jgi:tRNA(fMet)-specific endonuclease VapC
MPISYLLDTNTVSYLAKDSVPSVTRQFRRLQVSSIAISTVSEAELLYGLARKPDAHRIASAVHRLLSGIIILPWHSGAAEVYSHLRAALEREGKTMGDMDMMIAAHAIAEDAILVTNDAAFRRIEHLKVEDWTI